MQKEKEHVRMVYGDKTDEESDDGILTLEEVATVKGASKRITTKLLFSLPDNKKEEVECQLDTGATCNVMSYKHLMILLQDGNPPLEKSKVRLRSFDGTIVKLVGETTLMIEMKGRQYPTKFQIVELNSQPLISAETCKKLELISVNIEPVHAFQQVNNI